MSSDSIDLVLAVFREPARIVEMRDRPLPDDIARVIRLAAGENQALERAQEGTGESAETLIEASIFFLQQILFAPGADSYRVLGAASNVEQGRLRENYRWLMKWLHPDRNQDGWEAVYADRVNIAWQDLKTPDRRADYDLRNELAPASSVSTEMALRPRAASAVASGPILSGSTVKRLPAIVLGSLGVAAAAVVGLMYWAQAETQLQLSSVRENAVGDAVPAASAAASAQPGFAVSPDAAEPPAAEAAVAVPSPQQSVVPATVATESPDAARSELQGGVAATASLAVAPAVASSQAGTGDLSVAAQIAPEPRPEAGQESETPARAVRDDASSGAVARHNDGTPADAGARVQAELQAKAELLAKSQAQARAAAAAQVPASTAALAQTQGRSRPDALIQAETAAGPAAAPTHSRHAAGADLPSAGQNLASKPVVAAERLPTAVSRPPVATTPPEVSVAVESRVPAEADARALIREFASAYAAGDLRRFDQLFDSSRYGVPAGESMRSRFRNTEMRFLEIEQLRLTHDDQGTRARARYRDTYVPRGERRAVTETGTMEWVILLDSAGTARIAELARGG